MPLGRTELCRPFEVKHQTVTHPLFGEWCMRTLPSSQLTALRLLTWQASSGEAMATARLQQDRRAICLSLVDETGDPVLPEEQYELLDLGDPARLIWLALEIRKWVGLDIDLDGVIRIAEKN